VLDDDATASGRASLLGQTPESGASLARLGLFVPVWRGALPASRCAAVARTGALLAVAVPAALARTLSRVGAASPLGGVSLSATGRGPLPPETLVFPFLSLAVVLAWLWRRSLGLARPGATWSRAPCGSARRVALVPGLWAQGRCTAAEGDNDGAQDDDVRVLTGVVPNAFRVALPFWVFWLASGLTAVALNTRDERGGASDASGGPATISIGWVIVGAARAAVGAVAVGWSWTALALPAVLLRVNVAQLLRGLWSLDPRARGAIVVGATDETSLSSSDEVAMLRGVLADTHALGRGTTAISHQFRSLLLGYALLSATEMSVVCSGLDPSGSPAEGDYAAANAAASSLLSTARHLLWLAHDVTPALYRAWLSVGPLRAAAIVAHRGGEVAPRFAAWAAGRAVAENAGTDTDVAVAAAMVAEAAARRAAVGARLASSAPCLTVFGFRVDRHALASWHALLIAAGGLIATRVLGAVSRLARLDDTGRGGGGR